MLTELAAYSSLVQAAPYRRNLQGEIMPRRPQSHRSTQRSSPRDHRQTTGPVRNDNPHKATGGVDVADGKIDLFVRSENNWRGQYAASPDRQRPPSPEQADALDAISSGKSFARVLKDHYGSVTARSDLAMDSYQLGVASPRPSAQP